MQIGLNCFLDGQLSSMIESAARYGKCEITGKEDCIVYDTNQDDYLSEYLEEILDVFSVAKEIQYTESSDKVNYLKGFLNKWKIFSVDEDSIQIIIKEICKKQYFNNPEIFDAKVTVQEFFSNDIMEKQCILKFNTWKDFCNSIKHINRFHSHMINFDQLDKLLENMVIDCPLGSLSLFRSRICDEQHYQCGFPSEQMGVPPTRLASAGRTNSEGVQCLYLASDKETTFHEVRARDNDNVSVGRFVQVQDLRLVDLSLFDKIGPFDSTDFDMLWFAINIDIIRKIGDEVAKPIRRFDSHLDYVPTQYICDYIKYLGYDGIRFKSSLVNGGTNYAIFNEKNFECNSVSVVHINNIDYDYQ